MTRVSLYTARRISKEQIAMTKWEADRTDPLEVYYIFGSKCSCLGSLRQPYCRHMQVLAAFRELQSKGENIWGLAYDYDAQTFERWVPLEGVVNIRAWSKAG